MYGISYADLYRPLGTVRVRSRRVPCCQDILEVAREVTKSCLGGMGTGHPSLVSRSIVWVGEHL